MRYNEGDKVIKKDDLGYVTNPYHNEKASSSWGVLAANEKCFALLTKNLDPYLNGGIRCDQESGKEIGAWGKADVFLHTTKDKEIILSIVDEEIESKKQEMLEAGEKKIAELQADIDAIKNNNNMYSVFGVKNMIKKMHETRDDIHKMVSNK